MVTADGRDCWLGGEGVQGSRHQGLQIANEPIFHYAALLRQWAYETTGLPREYVRSGVVSGYGDPGAHGLEFPVFRSRRGRIF